jgi:REP element-mobilizing transposase RayT
MKYQSFETGHYFHIDNRGNNNENIFLDKENYTYFLKLMKKYLLQVRDIYSYCLLPNHFHILLKFKEDSEFQVDNKEKKPVLHQPFSNMLNAYTKSINKRYNRKGSLFQEHLKRIKITEEQYFLNLIIYVNTNPSHHQIEDFRVYKYSSYAALISQKETLLKRNEVIQFFDEVDNFKHVLKSAKLAEDSVQEVSLE